MRNRKKWLIALGITACLSSSPFAYAEELPEFNLDAIVIVDSRLVDGKKQTVTTAINVKEKINAGQIQTVADILQDIHGVIVQRGQNSGIWVSMRGLNHERTVVAINGNVVENIGEIKYGRALEWDAIPVNNVKKIEIIRGAGSAMYGGAIGGIINIITEENPADSKSIIRQSYGSWNTRKTFFSNQGTDNSGRFSWNINAARQESDGYYRNNASKGNDINLNVTYQLDKGKKLNFLFSDVYKKEGITIGNNQNGSPASSYLDYDDNYPETPNAPNNWVGGYREWNTDNVALNYTTATTRLGLYKYRQQRQEYVERMIRQGGKWVVSPLAKDWDSQIDNSGFNWQKKLTMGQHSLVYGGQYKEMDFDVYSSSSKYKLPSKSVFVQDEWQFDGLTNIGLALRYDRHEFEAGQGGIRSTNYSQLTPKLNITHKLQEGSYLYAGAGKFFRAPTAADYSRWNTGYEDADGAYRAEYLAGSSLSQWQRFLGVPEPEKGMSYEIGWRKALNTNTNIRLAGFYNDIDNYINLAFGASGNLTPPVIYNVDNVKVKGLEVAGDYRINSNWSLVAGYTRQSAEKSGDRLDAPLKALPEATFNLGARYSNLKGFQAALDLRYMGETPASSEGEKIDSYAVTDLSFSYTRGVHTVNLAVNNLFNRYYEVDTGYRMPGINYSISYQYAF